MYAFGTLVDSFQEMMTSMGISIDSQEYMGRVMTLKESTRIFHVALFLYCLHVAKKKYDGRRSFAKGAAENALASFGGGIVVPLMLSHSDVHVFPLKSEWAVPFVIVAFVMVRADVLGIRRRRGLFDLLLVAGFECARCCMLLNWCKTATKTLPASYYDVPVVGPLVCGTIGGCGGAFLPSPEKGLSAMREGVPFAMASAFAATAFYHTTVHIAPTHFPRIVMSDMAAHVVCVVSLLVIQCLGWMEVRGETASDAASTGWKKKLRDAYEGEKQKRA